MSEIMPPVLRNPRIGKLRTYFKRGPDSVPPDFPVDPLFTAECVAYGSDGSVLGRFKVVAADCLSLDTISWRGWVWLNSPMMECGLTAFPAAKSFGYAPETVLTIPHGSRPGAVDG